MSFREDYEYHVMNGRTGRLTYSCHTEKEAVEYANRYAGYTDNCFYVMRRTAAVYSVKSIKVEGLS